MIRCPCPHVHVHARMAPVPRHHRVLASPARWTAQRATHRSRYCRSRAGEMRLVSSCCWPRPHVFARSERSRGRQSTNEMNDTSACAHVHTNESPRSVASPPASAPARRRLALFLVHKGREWVLRHHFRAAASDPAHEHGLAIVRGEVLVRRASPVRLRAEEPALAVGILGDEMAGLYEVGEAR